MIAVPFGQSPLVLPFSLLTVLLRSTRRFLAFSGDCGSKRERAIAFRVIAVIAYGTSSLRT